MILFLLYVEPLLLCMEEVTKGVSLAAQQVIEAQAHEVVGLVERCEGFMDNLQAVCGSLADIIRVDT